jgi:hypothetical protein
LRLIKGQERVLTPDDRAWIEAAEENARALVAATKVEPQFVSNDERKRLHDILDHLLRTRERLEGLEFESLPPSLFASAWYEARAEFIESGSKFLRRVIGPDMHQLELSLLEKFELKENEKEPDHLATVANAVRSFMPLFIAENFGSSGREYMTKMMEDFMGIYWGDEPRFFSIATKNQGQNKRPFRIAHMRRGALDWELILKLAGVDAVERQNLVSSAYRTSWEAIRKWKYSIEESFGLVSGIYGRNERYIQDYLDDPNRIVDRIKNDGDAYWAEKQQG